MINRSMLLMSASAIISVCCGLSFADPATEALDGKAILKEVQAQPYEIARAGRARRRGYNAYNTAPVRKSEPQKEEKAVKDEQTNAAKDDAAKQEQKDVQDAVKTEQKDAKDAAQTEQKDAKDDEVKKDDNAAKEEEVKKDEPASPFKDPQEALAFEEFNKFRVRNGLKPCEFNQNLQNIAQRHSNNMYYSQRMYHSGTPGVAENVFMGSSSGVFAVRTWINSPGHRANMLGPYRRVGIARTGGFYTMVLQ